MTESANVPQTSGGAQLEDEFVEHNGTEWRILSTHNNYHLSMWAFNDAREAPSIQAKLLLVRLPQDRHLSPSDLRPVLDSVSIVGFPVSDHHSYKVGVDTGTDESRMAEALRDDLTRYEQDQQTKDDKGKDRDYEKIRSIVLAALSLVGGKLSDDERSLVRSYHPEWVFKTAEQDLPTEARSKTKEEEGEDLVEEEEL